MVSTTKLLSMSRRELKGLLTGGHAIEPADLDDTEYRGVSLGLPSVVERLTWKKFKKVFHRDPDSGQLRGWNVRMAQNGLDRPWFPLLEGGLPRTFGHYRVVVPSGSEVPAGCDRGLLIDYGKGGNGRLDPLRFLRDPIVALEKGSCELLLGWSFLDLGVTRIGTPSFFYLERDNALSYRADPPEGASG